MPVINQKPKQTLLISVCGAPHIGVTTACERVQRCLNAQGIITDVLTLERGIDVINFDDDYLLGRYMHLDVILFDKHRNAASAVKRRLTYPLWDTEGVVPDLSVLLSSSIDGYNRAIRNRSDKHKKAAHHEAYLSMEKAHYGTKNHHVVDVDGKKGQLYAAGTLKSLILRELRK